MKLLDGKHSLDPVALKAYISCLGSGFGLGAIDGSARYFVLPEIVEGYCSNWAGKYRTPLVE